MRKLQAFVVFFFLLSLFPAHARTGTAFFQLDSIITIRMYFPYPSWKDSLAANYASEREVPCTFIALGDTLDSVGVRYKGNSSYGLASGTKKSFKIDFDEFISGQRLDQLEMLNLNNSFKDPTLMREVLMYQYLNECGLTASRAAYANVYVNDEYRGLYVSVEESDEDEFLDEHFGESGGNLYKGDPNGTLQWLGTDTNLYRTRYEKHSNEEEDDWSDLTHFINRLNNVPVADLPDSLESLLDIHALMKFFAVNTLLVNLDSYQGTGHNYYIYHRSDGRFELYPWDLNEAFGNFAFTMPPNTVKNLDVFYLNLPNARPLFHRLWQTQAMKDLALHHLWDHLQGAWSPTAMNSKIDALYSLIQPSVYADTCKPYTTAQFETNLSSDIFINYPAGFTSLGLRSFVSVRTTSVTNQVNTLLGTRTLLINEVLASNTSTNQDGAGDYDDWVEIHNRSGSVVNLGSYFLTDDFKDPFKFEFPDVNIPAGGYVLVWCDNEPGEGAFHAPFRLDADHEGVYLFNADGTRMLDHVIWDTLTADISYARTPLTYYPWNRVIPTPAAANGNNTPPVITSVRRAPTVPTYCDAVFISARIRDSNGSITTATLAYDIGSGFQNATMHDDGQHGDSAAGDGRYGAQIPAQASSTTVNYYLEATDNEGVSVRHPVNAPVDVLNYVVDRPVPCVQINEFMAQNNSTIQDEAGTWEDWVELFNGGTDTVDLGGFALTDNFNTMRKWTFPDTTIAPGEFLLIWCDEDGGDPGLHANFKLSASGERLALSDMVDYGGAVLDSLTFGAQSPDISLARVCDGNNEWALDSTPTPDSANGLCAPEELTVIRTGDDIALRWRRVASAQSYQVFRLTNASDPISAGTIVSTTADTTAVLMGEIAAWECAFYAVIGVRP